MKESMCVHACACVYNSYPTSKSYETIHMNINYI
jgi:hypothetical protein